MFLKSYNLFFSFNNTKYMCSIKIYQLLPIKLNNFSGGVKKLFTILGDVSENYEGATF